VASNQQIKPIRHIEVRPNGPYKVTGGVPLVVKTQLVSECGEPLAWKVLGALETEREYYLCRCGRSQLMPFCDGTHRSKPFDGTEQAPLTQSVRRRMEYPGSDKFKVYFDMELCMESGFCANRLTSVAELVEKSDDIAVRNQLISMIEHCPSGALNYRIEGEADDIEVNLPRQVAITIEMTSTGPILGPLWVMGRIPILRADGQPFERRNRVTLCNCGYSQCKPLCDGTHRQETYQRPPDLSWGKFKVDED
jgi:CDGSH-type Zn-finger protein